MTDMKALQHLSGALLCGGLIFSTPAQAEINISEIANTLTLSGWGSGDSGSAIMAQEEFCITSTRLFSLSTYGVTASMNGGSQFSLQSGADQLPFKLYFSRHAANDFNELNYNQEAMPFVGAASCVPGQVALRIDVSQEAIAAVSPGLYRGNLKLVVRRMQGWFTQSKEVDLSIEVPSLVQISGLENMELRPDSKTTIAASQPFCVYATGGGSFSLAATSQQDGFKLSPQGQSSCGGGNCLPYQVEVKDKSGQGGVLTEGLFSHSWQGETAKKCHKNGNNMSLSISADTQEAGAGSYNDTLTLTVRPN